MLHAAKVIEPPRGLTRYERAPAGARPALNRALCSSLANSTERLELDGGVQTLRVKARQRPRVFQHAGVVVQLKAPPTREELIMNKLEKIKPCPADIPWRWSLAVVDGKCQLCGSAVMEPPTVKYVLVGRGSGAIQASSVVDSANTLAGRLMLSSGTAQRWESRGIPERSSRR